MPQMYSIWICNFPVDICRSYREELGIYRASDIGNLGTLPLYERKKYILIDLTKFDAKDHSIESEWLRLFRYMNQAKTVPKSIDDVLRDVYERMKVLNARKSFIVEVAESMIDKVEQRAILATARRKAREEGLAEGLAKGLAEGRAEGRAEAASEIASRDARIAELEAALAARR